MENQKFEVVCAQSHTGCVCKKASMASNRMIAVKERDIILRAGKLNSGRFIIDNISIKVLNVSDSALYAQFSGHLVCDDFIPSEKPPVAFLDITSVTGDHVEGDLTIKGIMHPVNFDVVINVNGDELTVTAKLEVDLAKIRYEIPAG